MVSRGNRLSWNGVEQVLDTPEVLWDCFDRVRQVAHTELWLYQKNGAALCVLTNRDCAWLMFLRDREGDAGFSSRDPDYAGPNDALIEFFLANGQCDAYPAAWTLSLEEALRGAEYFVLHGERAPWITWHDDSQGDIAEPKP
ncbi:MAG: hypothetical protein H7Z41_06530 [Cytophagales bacterium]|nr:hypothetical protein [Armatimonadota bacterium]